MVFDPGLGGLVAKHSNASQPEASQLQVLNNIPGPHTQRLCNSQEGMEADPLLTALNLPHVVWMQISLLG